MPIEKIKSLVEEVFQEIPEKLVKLPGSGSSRQYYRVFLKDETILAAFNNNRKENEAFIGFTNFFLKQNLPVPQILGENLEDNIYLLSDLGDTTLFSIIQDYGKSDDFSPILFSIYKKVLQKLPDFQLTDEKSFPYNLCYPRSSFDSQSMMWDLNYFKYYFLKLADIPFDEQALEDDFQKFVVFLLHAPSNYFLYRDFQSRNIMLKDGEPFFIDYQGGRKGALQYDVASLLYDAKANLPQETRTQLLEYYMDNLSERIQIDKEKFREYFYGFVLIRIMQAMGAYGFRGFYEKKELFLQSIPYALKNLTWLLENVQFSLKFNTLTEVLKSLTQSEYLKSLGKPKLTVRIISFSYKKGIPDDEKGNGGGFVFDCRAIHNPGKYEEYVNLNGRDNTVIQFLEKQPEAWNFLNSIISIVSQSIEKYQKRGFSDLMISFGCTGGQHRSVYCAEKIADYLKSKYDIHIILQHREQNITEVKK